MCHADQHETCNETVPVESRNRSPAVGSLFLCHGHSKALRYSFSGGAGWHRPRKQCPEDVNDQLAVAFDNVRRILLAEDLDHTALVKINIWLTETIDRAWYIEAWKACCNGEEPSATLYYVPALSLPQYKVEVEAIAARA